jgi:sarcosine oxidase
MTSEESTLSHVNGYDVIVVGLGGMGSAAAAHAAARGRRVLGLEQFQPAHDRGSSHGRSRVIRLAYFEHPAYVPLLRRAYELWRELEARTGRRLLMMTGGLMIGAPDSDVVSGSLRSARQYGIPHEVLDAADIRRRFPPLTPETGQIAFYETEAGVIFPEEAIRAHLDVAAANDADLRFDERVEDWRVRSDGPVEVVTSRSRYEAARLIIAPGPWAPRLFRSPRLPLEVERQVLYWFEPAGGASAFAPGRFPIYIWDVGDGVLFYGFPADGEGHAKVAFHRSAGTRRCTPESIERSVSREEEQAMRRALQPCLPALAAGTLARTMTCMYTLTPDHHFVIGSHPEESSVLIASPCSGHGYKFASVIGEILADLAIDGSARHAIDLFSPDRFTPNRTPADDA